MYDYEYQVEYGSDHDRKSEKLTGRAGSLPSGEAPRRASHRADAGPATRFSVSGPHRKGVSFRLLCCSGKALAWHSLSCRRSLLKLRLRHVTLHLGPEGSSKQKPTIQVYVVEKGTQARLQYRLS